MTCSPWHRLTLAATVLLIGFAAPVAGQAVSQAASAGPSVAAGSTTQPGVESQLLSLTNSSRVKAGLPVLVSSSTLVSIARGWSAHMAAAHSLSHNPSLAGAVSGWYSIGENVAEASSAAQAQSLFMASPDHRANILEPLYNRVGIGVVRAADGSLWFTVDFEQTAGYKPPAHKPAPHKTITPAKASTHPKAAPSAADQLAAARRAALARANRSLVRGTVPTTSTAASLLAQSAATERTQRLTGKDETVDLLAAPATPALALGPSTPAEPGSPGALIALGAIAVLMVGSTVAAQLYARRAAV